MAWTQPKTWEAEELVTAAMLNTHVRDNELYLYGLTRYMQPILFDFAVPVSSGDGKYYIHVPPGLNGFNLSYCHAEVMTAGTTNPTQVQIYNVTDAADMLTTKMTIDSAETGSDTAATAYVIGTAVDDVATNDVLRIDIDAVSTTPPKGLVVTLGFEPT
jgi:hypothetical protein